MRTALIIAGFLIVFFLVRRIADQNGRRISPAEVKKRLEAGEKVFLVDVRTPNEYAEKHLPKSLSLPLDRLEQEAAQKIPDKTAPVFLYCLTGRRSANGARILTKLGYSNVYNMGAMMNWPEEMETGDRSGA